MSTSSEAAPHGRRDRSKQQRQQRIVEAATQLLLERPFDDVTTKEVAAEAGIGEATLFRYISSKQELLTIVYGDLIDATLNQIEQEDAAAMFSLVETPTADFFIDRIKRVYHLRCDVYLVNPPNAARYLRSAFKARTVESSRPISQGDRTVRLVAQILREGQESGVLISSVDEYLVAQNCHGTYIHEIDRTPMRSFEPATIWDRLEPRLRVQLDPLAVERTQS